MRHEEPIADTIVAFARDAGKLALEYYHRAGGPNATRKADGSVVTDADKAVEKLLRERIRAKYPTHGIIGEEGTHHGALAGPDTITWVIDPIDGTSAFASRFSHWCVSIGVIKGAQAWRGAIYLPVVDEMYWVDDDGRARCGDAVIEAMDDTTAKAETDPTLLTTTKTHRSLVNNWPGRCLALGAVAADATMVARGVAAALIMRPYLWDAAGAMALVLASGGRCVTLAGPEIDLSPYVADPTLRPPEYWLLCAPAFETMARQSLRPR